MADTDPRTVEWTAKVFDLTDYNIRLTVSVQDDRPPAPPAPPDGEAETVRRIHIMGERITGTGLPATATVLWLWQQLTDWRAPLVSCHLNQGRIELILNAPADLRAIAAAPHVQPAPVAESLPVAASE